MESFKETKIVKYSLNPEAAYLKRDEHIEVFEKSAQELKGQNQLDRAIARIEDKINSLKEELNSAENQDRDTQEELQKALYSQEDKLAVFTHFNKD